MWPPTCLQPDKSASPIIRFGGVVMTSAMYVALRTAAWHPALAHTR